jgi:cobalt-zinc-cadmium efflux system protein
MLIKSSWGVVREAIHVLLEGVPTGISAKSVKASIMEVSPLIKNVDDLHIWSISSQHSALSCHIVIEECDLEKSMKIIGQIKEGLHQKFKIEHATIETELVECSPGSKS